MSYYQKHVFVCTNQKPEPKACCANHASTATLDYLKTRLLELGLHGPNMVRISKSGCLGRCAQGPCTVVYPEGKWFRLHSEADVDIFIEDYLQSGAEVPAIAMDS